MAIDQHNWKNSPELMKRSRDAAYTHSPYNPSQAPWTATRCLRLLRPISSKISTLEKLRKSGENWEDEDLFYDLENDRKIAHSAVQMDREHLDESWDIDPRPRKKVKRTYSARQKRTIERDSSYTYDERQKKSVEDDLTNLRNGPSEARFYELPRIGAEIVGKERNDPFGTLFNGMKSDEAYRMHQHVTAKHVAELNGLRQSKKATCSNSNERLKLCQGIASSLSSLLRATNGAAVRNKWRGASSLYAMCLKRLPHFIAEEEAFAKIEQPDTDQDVISDIYTHLESMAISDSWKPLRTVVRSHGIQHICVAIDQRILSIGMALEMLNVCLQEEAYNESLTIMHQIMHTFLQRPETLPESPLRRDQSQILEGFLRMSSQINDGSPMTRVLSKSLKSPSSLSACEPLLISPTVSAMNSVTSRFWDASLADASLYIRAINQASVSIDPNEVVSRIAAKRTRLALKSKRSLRHQRAHNDYGNHGICISASECAQTLRDDIKINAETPISIPYILISMTASVLTYQETPAIDDSALREYLEDLLEAMAQETRQFLETGDSEKPSMRQRQAIMIVLLAKGLSRISSAAAEGDACRPLPEFSTLAGLDLQNTEVSLCGVFVHRVVELCEQVGGAVAFDMINRLLEGIMQLITKYFVEKQDRLLLQRLAVASAFAFSEASKQPRHLEWALGIEERIFGKDCLSPDRSALRTPAKILGKSRIGYRWEDGICEWISKTPASAINQTKKISIEEEGTIDELGDTTLVEAWPTRLPEESGCEKSPSNLKQIATQEASMMTDKCDSVDEIKVASICVKEINSETSNSDKSSNAAVENTARVLASKLHDEDEIDELSDYWGSQPSTQSSFQRLQSKSQSGRNRSSRIGSRTRSQGHHRLLSKAVERSLSALLDNEDQSSDMEDELGI